MPAYTPEPLPLSIDPVLAEYLNRELMRISNTFIGSDEDVAAIDYQPHDADLDAISVLVTQAYGRQFLTYSTEAAFKAAVNLEANVDFSPQVHGSTFKAVPVDADEFGYVSSTSGPPWQWRYFTWANLRAAFSAVANIWSGQQTFVSNPIIQNASPSISFIDTDVGQSNFLIHVNNSTWYVLPDRNQDGAWEGPYAIQLDATTNIGYIFGGQVWTNANDGAGSALDADLVDGFQSSQANVGNTVAIRDAAGDVVTRLFRSEWASGGSSNAYFLTQSAIGSAVDNYARPMAIASVGASLAPYVLPAYGSIGSYLLAYTLVPLVENGSYAGSALKPAGILGDTPADDTSSSTVRYTKGGSVMAGTWRCLGRAQIGTGVVTLFQRIA